MNLLGYFIFARSSVIFSTFNCSSELKFRISRYLHLFLILWVQGKILHLFWLIHGSWIKVLSLLWIHLIVLPSLKYRKPKYFQPIVILIEKIAWGFRTKENGSLCTVKSGLGQKGNFMNLLSKVVEWPKVGN